MTKEMENIALPRFFPEPQSLSSKKDREKKNTRYAPPAPRTHILRSAPTATRLIHSRSHDFHDLDSSFQLLSQSNVSGTGATQTFFRQYFEIQERLGYGSFGDVFRVKSKIDGSEFAIKKSRKTYTGEGDRSRQLREVQRVVNIPTNLHLVELERAWEEEGHLYLQMELCRKSLSQDIEEHPVILNTERNEIEAWNVLIDMLLALQHLHKYRLVHMDVKPDNIFLTRDTPPVYKLGDFGIVVSLDEKQDVSEFSDGDSRYLAPEVIQHCHVSTRADVFSLGMTILEVACHVDLPKSGPLWHKLRSGGEFPDPCDKLCPPSLVEVLHLMIEPDVAKRAEVSEILAHPTVKSHWRRRYWTLVRAKVSRKMEHLLRFWRALLSFLAITFFLKPRPDKILDQSFHVRATPEPPIENKPGADLMNLHGTEFAVPELLVNDSSFSDDEEHPASSTTPIFASTPISTSKSTTASRLRSGRVLRFGDPKPMGSPTSRNLLKEFEAVSE